MKKIKAKKASTQPYNNGADVLEFIRKATELSLKKRNAYSVDICEELSAETAFNVFNALEKQEITELYHYIRTCVKNSVVNYLSKSSTRQEVATDPIDMPILDTRVEPTALDSLIREEYLDIHTRQLERIREEIGARDYEMLEAHFRDGDSYKIIADRMALDLHIVANHINRARTKCQKLRDEGHISY